MLSTICVILLQCLTGFLKVSANELETISVIDLTHPTNWKDLATYYGALEKRWKMCINCGAPSLGTAMHLEHIASVESMHPAVIPPEYFLTERMAGYRHACGRGNLGRNSGDERQGRFTDKGNCPCKSLHTSQQGGNQGGIPTIPPQIAPAAVVIIDASAMTELQDNFVLSLEVALQWEVMKRDPQEPTLLLFKFGWHEEEYSSKIRSCVCKIPGLSYELAEWISANLSHVVGVATDAPTLESEQTREFSTRTISNLLGKNGLYMIENVNVKRKIPEHGCMAVVSPLKLLNANYVPTRLTAYCPTHKTHSRVALTLKERPARQVKKNRIYDIELDEILY